MSLGLGAGKRVLVTGGAGFIGSHVVDALVAEGREVVVLDNLFRSRPDYLAPHMATGRICFLQADIRDGPVIREALRGVTLVFHLAAQSQVFENAGDLAYSFDTNVRGTFHLLQAAAEGGIRRVVFASSREVYGEAGSWPVSEETPPNAKNAYGASKVAAETYCKSFAQRGLEVAVLRLSNVYGIRDTQRVVPLFVQNALRGVPLKIFGGDQVLDFIWINDVVRALFAATQEGWPWQTPVNVASGVGVPIRELAERIVRLTHAKVGIELAPPRALEVRRFVACVERLHSLMGVPSQPLDPLEHLVEIVAYWKQRLASQCPLDNKLPPAPSVSNRKQEELYAGL